MPPEKLLQFRIVQIDIIVCWAIYILRAMVLPAMIVALLVVESKLAKSIRKDERKAKLHRIRE